MKYEIDTTGIEAGDIIDQHVCESVIGYGRKGREYDFQFELMQLADQIARELWKDGKRFTVTVKDGSICVLTHEQASQYNQARFENAKGKMRRCHKRLVAVDTSKFTRDAAIEHMEAIAKQSRTLQMIRSRSQLVVEPTERKTPTRLKR